jgi:hypothetical protein
MADQKIFHGARAQLIVNGKKVGVFSDVSYGVNYDVQPAFILGRYSAAELTYVGQDVVSVSATGFRVIDNGAYVAASMPKLQELMGHNEISIELFDRQSNKSVLSVIGVRPVSWSSGQQSRSLSTFSVQFMGRLASDESGVNDEGAGASTITSGT